MRLILRVACNRNNSQRAQEARRLLRTTPVPSPSLIQRIALSNGDSQRAQAARELLNAMRKHATTPGYVSYPGSRANQRRISSTWKR
jgi:fructose-bisphosphate aldolase class 1